MEVTRVKGMESGFDYHIKEDDKELRIIFGGNLDLYWQIINYDRDIRTNKKEDSYETFCITKENYTIYKLFKDLIDRIKECQVYEIAEEESDFLQLTMEEFEVSEFKQTPREDINNRLKESSEYQKLYDGEAITWRSDDECFEISSRVRITEVEDNILLEFFRPGLEYEQMRMYGVQYQTPGEIGIRFRNSGSVYDPFNCVFMRMFQELQEYDPEYHQIHLEEMAYKKTLKQKKVDK